MPAGIFVVMVGPPNRATWSMGDWQSFHQFVAFTEKDVEGCFFRAVLALRKDDLTQCTRYQWANSPDLMCDVFVMSS